MLLTTAPSGCLDDKCDANQVYVDAEHQATCACAPGTVPDQRGYGCTPCGPNEEPQGDKCACRTGFTRQTPDAVCTEVVGQELGASCAASACTEPHPYCATDGADRYCTHACTRTADCPETYRCETGFCAKVSGLGKTCAASADCAGTDAPVCETMFAKVCIITGCELDRSVCPQGTACCMFPTGASCAPAAMCSGTVLP